MDKNKYIWYVCYGSNLCFERFMCYLTSKGSDKYNIAPLEKKCKNQSKPLRSKRFDFNHKLYFAHHSPRWDEKGIAFVDRKPNNSSKTIGRAYLITKEQYEFVKENEGKLYEYEIDLGLIDGIPAKTFTLSLKREFRINNDVSDRYKEVMIDGLMELGLTRLEAQKYINEHLR